MSTLVAEAPRKKTRAPVSANTRSKQACLRGIVNALLSVFKDDKKAGRFVYFDMTAFEGKYTETDGSVCPGSPIVFLEEAKSLDVPTLSVLFEILPGRYHNLVQNVVPLSTARHLTFPIRFNSTALIGNMTCYADDADGLIYIDSCGALPPLKQLAESAQDNVDLLLHADLRMYWRKKGTALAAQARGEAKGEPTSFDQQFAELRKTKRFWFIKKPAKFGNHTWLTLYGCNARWRFLAALEKLGFYELGHTEEGKQFYAQTWSETVDASDRPVKTGKALSSRTTRTESKPASRRVSVSAGKRIRAAVVMKPQLRRAIAKRLKAKVTYADIVAEFKLKTTWYVSCVHSWLLVQGSTVLVDPRSKTASASPVCDSVERRLRRARLMPPERQQAIEAKLRLKWTQSRIVKKLGVPKWDVGCVSVAINHSGRKPTSLQAVVPPEPGKTSAGHSAISVVSKATGIVVTAADVKRLVELGKSRSEIVKALSICDASVERLRRAGNLPPLGLDGNTVLGKKRVETARIIAERGDEIREARKTKSTAAVAAEFGLSQVTVWRRFGPGTRNPRRSIMRQETRQTEARRLRAEQGLSHRAIAELLGCSSSAISRDLLVTS